MTTFFDVKVNKTSFAQTRLVSVAIRWNIKFLAKYLQHWVISGKYIEYVIQTCEFLVSQMKTGSKKEIKLSVQKAQLCQNRDTQSFWKVEQWKTMKQNRAPYFLNVLM